MFQTKMYKPPYKSRISTDKGQSVVSVINKQTPVTSAGCSKSQVIQDDRDAVNIKKVSKIQKSATKKGSKSTKSETELKAKPSKQSILPPKPVRPVSAFLYYIQKYVPIFAEQGNKDGITKASEMWRSLSQAEKNEIELEFQNAKLKYQEDLNQYNKSKKQLEENKMKKKTPVYNIPSNKYIKMKGAAEVDIDKIPKTQIEKQNEIHQQNNISKEGEDMRVCEQIVENIEVARVDINDKDVVVPNEDIETKVDDDEDIRGENKMKHFVCKCTRSFSSLFWYEKHKQKCSEEYACDQCERKFKNTKSLRKHIRVVHIKGKLCNVCGKTFSTDMLLRSHIDWKHTTPVPCPKCQKMFKNKNSMKKHKHFCEMSEDNTNNPKEKFNKRKYKETLKESIRCADCPKSFDSKRGLRAHKAKFHRAKSDSDDTYRPLASDVIDFDDFVFEDTVEVTDNN